MIITYLIRNVKPSFVLIFSILMMCFCGYDNTIGDEYSLARIINFFPFFYIGVICSPQKVYEFFQKRIFKILGVIIIGVWAYFCFMQVEYVYPFRNFFTGRNSYNAIFKATQIDVGFSERLLATSISILLCFAFLSLMVNRRIPFITKIGTRTLQIYFWHRTVLYILMSFDLPQKLARYFPNHYEIYYIFIAVAVTLILSLKPFGLPLKAVMNCISSKLTTKQKNNLTQKDNES